MPIRFRCSHCNRLLGIATRKAGTATTCPHCRASITVPAPDGEPAKTERLNLDDVDRLLGPQATERVTAPATQVLEAPRAEAPRLEPPAPPKAEPEPRAAGPEEQPLFENDFDLMFGDSATPLDDRPKPPPVSGPDALSLDPAPRMLVLSPQQATLLMGGVVVLLALAFAAGYLVAR